ncbi:RibD family protein [Oleisolibacter albus]|uniref:RibD family protein n=1 Tax=Oleisolibacter albus TaxID=2171757 RepID=UPI000DF3040B|nr:RibD family protein [Oleisolibacter albus]
MMDLVQLSVCMSLDGHIDSAGADRLLLSSPEDSRDMHAARAACDAILVGAGTVRRDDPRLTVRDAALVARRLEEGRPEHPAKVTLTRSGRLDPAAGFFRCGGRRLVLCPAPRAATLRDRLGEVAEVVVLDDPVPAAILATLAGCGIRRLLVEGGTGILTQFLAAGAFHRLRLAMAPFFVGQAGAPRLTHPGRYLHGPGNRLRVERVRQLGDVVVTDLVNGTPRLAAE